MCRAAVSVSLVDLGGAGGAGKKGAKRRKGKRGGRGAGSAAVDGNGYRGALLSLRALHGKWRAKV